MRDYKGYHIPELPDILANLEEYWPDRRNIYLSFLISPEIGKYDLGVTFEEMNEAAQDPVKAIAFNKSIELSYKDIIDKYEERNKEE